MAGFDRRRLGLLAVRYGLFFALGAWVVAMSFASEHFLTWLNFLNVARQAAPIIVIAVGMTFVMATAGIDLSVGSLVALISVLIVTFFGLGLPAGVVIPAVLVLGLVSGLVNGYFVQLGLPPFVVTLAMLTTLRGIAFVVSDGYATPVKDDFVLWLGRGKIGPVHTPIVLAVIVAVVGWVVLSKTRFGLYSLAVGGREEAARAMGINVRGIKLAVYGTIGLLGALAGIVLTGRLGNGSPNAGIMLEARGHRGHRARRHEPVRRRGDHRGHRCRCALHQLRSQRAEPARREPVLGSGRHRIDPAARGAAQHRRESPGDGMGESPPDGGTGTGTESGSGGRAMTAPLIEMRNISKSFGAVVALRQVSLTVDAGEVVGLVGDNAAGKSTLMKILSGVYTPDTGEVVLDGRPRSFASPMDARGAGIEMVYQDFALVPELSVTRNIFLGRELLQSGLRSRFVDKASMRERATYLLERLGLRVPPVDTPVRAISGGQQQAVAIARATAFDARLVIMDEPTANLAAAAIGKVRAAIGRLKSHGVAVVVISHRIEDVLETADRAVVLKHGTVVGERRIAETGGDELVHMIVAGQDPRGEGGRGAGTPPA